MLINCVTPNPPLELVPSGHLPPLLRRQESLSSTRGFKELKKLPAFRAARCIGRRESYGWVGGTVSYIRVCGGPTGTSGSGGDNGASRSCMNLLKALGFRWVSTDSG